MEETIEFLEEISEELENFNKEYLQNKLNKKITEMQLKQREALGWGDIHQLIETAPYCHHKEQIIIMRFCPKCKRHPRDNVCNLCNPEEEMESVDEIERECEIDCEIFGNEYDPYGVYFRKKVCDDCCKEKKDQETWICSKCTAAAA